jgi:hypothetical protein
VVRPVIILSVIVTRYHSAVVLLHLASLEPILPICAARRIVQYDKMTVRNCQ